MMLPPDNVRVGGGGARGDDDRAMSEHAGGNPADGGPVEDGQMGNDPVDDDPRPLEPERPLPMDCCDSGCDVCVHDLYAEQMDHYRQQLARWIERHPQASADRH